MFSLSTKTPQANVISNKTFVTYHYAAYMNLAGSIKGTSNNSIGRIPVQAAAIVAYFVVYQVWFQPKPGLLSPFRLARQNVTINLFFLA